MYVPRRRLKRQLRHFREFRNTATDMENTVTPFRVDFVLSNFADLFHAQTARLHTKES